MASEHNQTVTYHAVRTYQITNHYMETSNNWKISGFMEFLRVTIGFL